MTGKKQLLASSLASLGITRSLLPSASRNLIIFNYHRIRTDDATQEFRFDQAVFGPTVSVLDRQLRWLAARVQVLSEDSILQHIRNQEPISGPAAMITFDDGYADNYHLALPLLKKYGLPATFFIPTESIERRQLGWWDIFAYLVKKTTKPVVRLLNREFTLPAQKRDLQQQLVLAKKTRPAADTLEMVSEVAQACEVNLPAFDLQDRELMTWNQIRDTRDAGITIGSHTHTHRVLATLQENEQQEELTVSKQKLETQLGSEVRTLAYPVGGYEHFTQVTQKLALQCGYKAAFSFGTGLNRTTDLAPFDIRRVSPNGDYAMMAAMLTFPRVFVSSYT